MIKKLRFFAFLLFLIPSFCFSQSRTYRYPNAIIPVSCPQNQGVEITVTSTPQIIPAPRLISTTNYTTGTVTTPGKAKTTNKIEGSGTLWLSNVSVGRIFKLDEDTDILENWKYIILVQDDETIFVDRNYAKSTDAKSYTISTPVRACSYIIHNIDTVINNVRFKGIDGANLSVDGTTNLMNGNTAGDIVNSTFDVERRMPVNGVLLWSTTSAVINLTYIGRDFTTP